MLKVLVLGSAAGGGSPQWNCNSEVSKAVRRGDSGSSVRTQSSIAVTADNENWFLFNASPDLGSQIINNPQMHPKKDLRHSPIKGVVLTNGDVDHVAGLLSLRVNIANLLFIFFFFIFSRACLPIKLKSFFELIVNDKPA